MEFNITGIEAAGKKMFETFSKLRPTGFVTLVPEPDNKYDPFCIGVFYGDVRIGYIPALKEGGVYVGSELQRYIIDNKLAQLPIVKYAYIDQKGSWNDQHVGHLQSVTLCLPTEEVEATADEKYTRVTEFISHFNDGGKSDNLIVWALEKVRNFLKVLTAQAALDIILRDKSFAEIYQSILQETADDGIAMHARIEEYFRWPTSCPDMPYPKELLDKLPAGFINFIEKYQPKVAYMEERFYDDTLMVTGQPDMVCYINGKLVVVDWKSSKAVSMKHRLQVSIYAKNAKHEGNLAIGAMVVCFGAPTKQGYSLGALDLEKINRYYEAMKHLRSVIDICKGL